MRTTLAEALRTWAALRAPTVKPRTRHYHWELIGTIYRYWPEKFNAPVVEISAQDLAEFVSRLPLSSSRFNGIVSMLKAVLPAAKTLRRRRVALKERPLLSQGEFSKLLAELDRRPRSHAGMVVRFLAHTGLRINEARLLKWSDVHDGYILAPGGVTKNGSPRKLPFVNGLEDVLKQLRELSERGQAFVADGVPNGWCAAGFAS